jgi:hypothetical protein
MVMGSLSHPRAIFMIGGWVPVLRCCNVVSLPFHFCHFDNNIISFFI